MKKYSVLLIPLLLAACGDKNTSSNCFDAKSKTLEIAQQIRQESKSMGWDVGHIKSTTVAGIIKGKRAIYPDARIEICLKEKDGDLKFIMNSDSKDAGDAEWHFLSGSKNGSY